MNLECDERSRKLLHEQREAYFDQSKNTKGGKVAEFVMPDHRAIADRIAHDEENEA